MKSKIYLLFFLVMLFTVNACKEVEVPDTPPIAEDPKTPGENPEPEPIVNLPKTTVSVKLPSNSTLDLSKTKLVTGFIAFPVQSNGSSEAVIPIGTTRISYLVDEQENVLMAGFVNDQQKEISPATTAEVIAYFTSDLVFGPDELDDKVFGNFDQLPGFQEFSEAVVARISQNYMLLEGAQLEGDLQKFYNGLGQTVDEIDIRARQINVSPGGVQSGIQMYDVDFQNIKIKNRFRRRTHAFLYKTSFKNQDGEETVLISSVGGNDQADKDFSIVPTKAIRSFLGVLSDWTAGKGMEFAETVSDPVNIPLAENESEATYKVRIIGPGLVDYPSGIVKMTNDEKEKWNTLMLETFALDFLIPAMSAVIGHKNSKGEKPYLQNYEGFLKVVKEIIAAEPAIKDLIEKGEFKLSLKAFLWWAYETNKGKWPNLVKALMADLSQLDPNAFIETPDQIEAKTNQALRMVALVDNVILATDIARFSYHIVRSNSLEEFEVISREHDVKLSPQNTSVTVFTNKDFTVESKAEIGQGMSFLYKWSTSGTYGTIQDGMGNNGKEFESTQKKVTYRATASNIPEDARETISVGVYVKEGQTLTKIGEATETFTVKSARLELKPDGITLVGKERQTVALYVEWANGDAFENASSFDYKYEWSTAGLYGKFDGKMETATTRNPRIVYQAVNEEVEEGVENIKVDIYMRRKDGGEWFQYHTAEGTVKVNNDDNYLIYHEAFALEKYDHIPSDRFHGYTNYLKVDIPKNEEYEEFSVRLYGFKIRWSPSREGIVLNWKKGGNVPILYDIAAALRNPVIFNITYPEDVYGVGFSVGSRSCPISIDCSDPFLDNPARYGGMAEIKIKLKK